MVCQIQEQQTYQDVYRDRIMDIIVHNISVQQNPNVYVITEFVRDEMFIYFKINNDKDNIGVFHINGLIYLLHNRTTKTFLYPILFENDSLGYYYEIKNSDVLREIKKNKLLNNDEYHHFIFENYKYWIEVIAKNVNFYTIKSNKKLKYLWETIC